MVGLLPAALSGQGSEALDFRAQARETEGFGEIGGGPVFEVGALAARHAGKHHDRCGGLVRMAEGEHVPAITDRHFQIGQNEVRVFVDENRLCRQAVFRFEHPIAAGAKNQPDACANLL